MRNFLLLVFSVALSITCQSQLLTAGDFTSIPSIPQKKVDGYLSRIGFARGETQAVSDTVIQSYYVRDRKTKFIDYTDSRLMKTWYTKQKSGFIYSTSSQKECVGIIKGLKDGGFFCESENVKAPFVYQKDDITISLSSWKEDTLNFYRFLVTKENLPRPGTIRFAEDFLGFNSHENLVYVFGKANVQKDVYYFSDSNIVRCSILFPNTNRQVIFVWEDEINRCSISHLLIGNSLRGNASVQNDQPVAENLWTLRNGLRASMSLSELVKITKADFNFYGWNSPYPGIVEPSKKGDIDFARTGVVLSCLNCHDSDFLDREIISADDAIRNSKRMFVLAVIVMPGIDTETPLGR